jgi:hypothetical protein
VVICDHLVGDHSGALDGLAKEGLGTGRVASLAEQDIDDHAILVNGAIQVPLLSLAEQEHLVDEPAPADRTPSASHLGCQLWSERLDPVEIVR